MEFNNKKHYKDNNNTSCARSLAFLGLIAAIIRSIVSSTLVISVWPINDMIFFERLSTEQKIATVPEDARGTLEGSTAVASFPAPTFIDHTELEGTDEYSAAWWMSRQRFLTARPQSIPNLEGCSFALIDGAGRGKRDLRMARDWLDFSVEHLSAWQKFIESKEGDRLAMRKCDEYVQRHQEQQRQQQRQQLLIHQGGSTTFMNTTLALLPFGVPDGTPLLRKKVWASYITAAATALLKNGVKRIVLVGHFHTDARIALQVISRLTKTTTRTTTTSSADHYFTSSTIQMEEKGEKEQARVLHQKTFHVDNNHGSSTRTSRTEIVYVQTKDVDTKFHPNNVPRGALVGLQNELLSPVLNNGNRAKDENVKGSFLGNHAPTDFDYIYFTEPDQILNARLSEIFLTELNRGRVLVPHRLQPVPHTRDIKDNGVATALRHQLRLPVEDVFPVSSHPHAVASTASCCDSVQKRGEKTCDGFWWQCGYDNGDFSHFEPFQLMSLSSSGTGIVTLAGNEHGRMCHLDLTGRGSCQENTLHDDSTRNEPRQVDQVEDATRPRNHQGRIRRRRQRISRNQ